MYNYYILLLILLVLILILIIIPHKYIIHRPISQNSLDLIMGNNNKSETFSLKLNYISNFYYSGKTYINYIQIYETPIINKDIILNNCSYIISGSFKTNKIYDPLDFYSFNIEFWVTIDNWSMYVKYNNINVNYDFNLEEYTILPTQLKYNLISGIDKISLHIGIFNSYNNVSYVYNPNITYNINLDYITFNI